LDVFFAFQNLYSARALSTLVRALNLFRRVHQSSTVFTALYSRGDLAAKQGSGRPLIPSGSFTAHS